jgi:hypothetical protein
MPSGLHSGSSEPTQSELRVEFAPWETIVENDELWLADLAHRGTSYIGCQKRDLLLSLNQEPHPEVPELQARFFSIERSSLVCFSFSNVAAFRVQHERGYLELWEASVANDRPAMSTFRVRGHGWQNESFLNWWDPSEFSYLIATNGDCLEVVTTTTPSITFEDVAISKLSKSPYQV